MDLTLDSRGGANWLLGALSGDEREAVAGRLEPVELPFKQVLVEAHRPIDWVYFIDRGVMSVTVEQTGGTMEVATVGDEGIIGLPAFLGTDSSPMTAFAQVPGVGRRMPVETFHRTTAEVEGLSSILLRYAQALMYQTAQSAACIGRHSTAQRAARWLLMTHDRAHADTFPLTQEFLAQMLGVRRATVNGHAVALEESGVIGYTRGSITIRDRDALLRQSCECYARIRGEYERLLRPQDAD